jgi:site-specific DNA-methyltransferase (adenine-specific)
MSQTTSQKWKIGDCIELLEDVPDESMDLVFTDPPYGILYHSGYYKKGNPHTAIKNDGYFDVEFNKKWLSLCSQKAKKTSSILLFSSHQVLVDWIPLVQLLWNVKNIIIWVKNNWTAGDLKGNLGNQYECIIFGTRGDFSLEGYRFSNVWNFDRVPPTHHPTMKPIALIRRGIEITTKEGDSVLDPFLGSGTTLRACRETNRNCIGFEIDSKYEEAIKYRSMVSTPDITSFLQQWNSK